MLYPKIQSVFLRDPETRHKTFLMGQWSTPELAALADVPIWEATEKVDGTNIRVSWDPEAGTVTFGGRTENAQIPAKLVDRLRELFPEEKFLSLDLPPLTLFGEGYGAGIQKGGGDYLDHQDFILFDVRVGDWWLRSEDVTDVAGKLGIRRVPIIGLGRTLQDYIDYLAGGGFSSALRHTSAEGMVLRTVPELRDRRGDRIITKIKARDFARVEAR